MNYYTVWVRSQKYRGSQPLTYSHGQLLAPASIVEVELQRTKVLGFVAARVVKPAFPTKPILTAYALPPLPSQIPQLTLWLQQFYGTTLGTATQQVLPPTLSNKIISALESVVPGTTITPGVPLTDTQTAVVKNIQAPDTYLLHGKTGSGKTRIYIELATRAVKASKSALVLTPEISLTSQLARSFQATFGNRVVILHSQLSSLEHQQAWLRILTTKTPLIVIGPRSALFSPLRDIGLIVLDEGHEQAYKQEQAPYYHAGRVASQLARLHTATLIIGSATPSINDYYLAQQRKKTILRMDTLATPSEQPATSIQIVDLKDRGQFARSPQLSNRLLGAIQTALERHEQSLIYLNRRGTSRIVLCENCGWQANCPHCDLPLVYHGDTGQLRCHTCGYREALRLSCPVCSHPSILFKSFGTKAVYDEVHRLFPEARVQRFDTDNKKSERFEQHYDAVRAGNVDILIGTQLLAKGLDLPRLSTLGILLADSSLYLPDFSASERTFQLLSQVLGRVGRGHVAGHAVIQTYQPASPILRAAVADDWETFYRSELAERQKFHFPPFYHLLKLQCRRATTAAAEKTAANFKATLTEQLPGIVIDGPAPSFHEKLQGKYQYQLVVKSIDRSTLLRAIQLLPKSGWTYDIDPINLL